MTTDVLDEAYVRLHQWGPWRRPASPAGPAPITTTS